MSFTLPSSQQLSSLIGDDEIAALLSDEADIAAMLAFERALAKATAFAGLTSAGAVALIEGKLPSFKPDMQLLRTAMARDGASVPELVRQLRGWIGELHALAMHFGATSQDVIDTSMIMRMKSIANILDGRLSLACDALQRQEAEFGSRKLMGRTRMQQALPISAGDRLKSWRLPLLDLRVRLKELSSRVFVLQLGGAVGTNAAYGSKAGEMISSVATSLGLGMPAQAWHTSRANLVSFSDWLSHVTGALGKIGQDICLMAQNEIAEIKLGGTGGSSAMAHKSNPVKAEVLVALARFNATLVSGMHQAIVHEQERSGSAMTLEWMLLPQMALAAGAATRTAGALIQSIEDIGQ